MTPSRGEGNQRIPPSFLLFCSVLRDALHQRWPRFFRPFSLLLDLSLSAVSLSLFPSLPRLISWALPPFCDMKFEQQRVISHEPNEYLRLFALVLPVGPVSAVTHSLTHSAWSTTTIGVGSEEGGRKSRKSRPIFTPPPRHVTKDRGELMHRDRLRLFAPSRPRPRPSVRLFRRNHQSRRGLDRHGNRRSQ